jgi:uncharacterized protein
MKIKTDLKVKWHFIAIFYAIAFSLSGLFNSGYLTASYQSLTKGYFISDMNYLPACIGTLVAALSAFLIDKSYFRTISFSGNSSLKNITIAVTPFVVFSIIGLDNDQQLNRHYFAFAFAGINLAYAVMEEIFWRGYLQDALRPLTEKLRFLLIGVLWWAWHFRFNTSFDFTVFLLICVGGSFLIGLFTEKSKSFFAAGGLHCLVILLTSSGEMTTEKMLAGGLTLLIWIAIGKWWLTLNDNVKKSNYTKDQTT